MTVPTPSRGLSPAKDKTSPVIVVYKKKKIYSYCTVIVPGVQLSL